MKKEYILSEEEKQQKKQKIEENRIRKRTIYSSKASPDDPSSPASPQSGSMSPNLRGRPQARVLPSTRSKSEDPAPDEDKIVPGRHATIVMIIYCCNNTTLRFLLLQQIR